MNEKTILLLAGVGIVGYGLIKSDFFKGLGGVGAGVGEAVQSGGGFVRETFIQGGETIRDVGQLIQTTTDSGQSIIYEVGAGASNIIRETGSLGVDILSENTGLRGISQNIGGLAVDTTKFIREISPFNILENLPSTIKTKTNEVLSGGTPTLRGVSPYTFVSPIGAIKEGATGTINKVKEVISGGSSVVKSSNNLSTPKETPKITLPTSGGMSIRQPSAVENFKKIIAPVNPKTLLRR